MYRIINHQYNLSNTVFNIKPKSIKVKQQQTICARMIKIDTIEHNLSKTLSIRVGRLKPKIL